MKQQHLLFTSLIALFGLGHTFQSQATTGTALVRSLTGKASYVSPEGKGVLQSGMTLKEGASVTTDPDSHVDLYLLENGGVMRIESDSTVKFAALRYRRYGRTSSFATDVQVTRGNIVANITKKLNPASHYRIRTPTGLVGVRGTSLQAGAAGVFTLTGTVEFKFNNGTIQPIIGGTILPAGSTSPIKATQAQTIGLAQSATGSTLNATGNAALLQHTVETFAAAIAAQAAQDAGNDQAASIAASVTASVVQALVTAAQSAANELPPAQKAQVQLAVTALNAQIQTISAKAAAKAAVAAVISNGGTPAQAQTAANQAADNATTDPGARNAAKGQIAGAVTAAGQGGSLAAMVDNVAAQTAAPGQGPGGPGGPGGPAPPPPGTQTTLIPISKDIIDQQTANSGVSPNMGPPAPPIPPPIPPPVPPPLPPPLPPPGPPPPGP